MDCNTFKIITKNEFTNSIDLYSEKIKNECENQIYKKRNYINMEFEDGEDLMEDYDIFKYNEDMMDLHEERYDIIYQFMIDFHFAYLEYIKQEKLKLLMKTNKLCFDMVYYEINKYF